MVEHAPYPQQPDDSRTAAEATGGERLRRIAPARTLEFGEHRLTYLPDGFVQLIPGAWFPETGGADWQRHTGHLDDAGYLVASVGGLLVEHRGRALLIDTGYGPRRTAPADSYPFLGAEEGGRLPAALAAHGLAPGAVDTVAFTHLHEDHTGWAFAPDPAGPGLLFGAARFVTSATEWQGWYGAPSPAAARHLREHAVGAADGQEVFPGVTAWNTPGHTLGHTSYVISSGGRRLVVIGDALHSAVQVERPDWRVLVDSARDVSVETRLRILRELSVPDTLGFGGHFADVQFGRVVTDGSQQRWEALDHQG
ncbi:MBL fold metallo-hydrolase [Kitasatospora sp. NPDC097643]|uniref:MBL fold metallo-hydrolase n=1 Tax=Kitasatospora sp. NPDC097643 TaxID=3157230 RepID=UPI00332928F4